MTCREVNHCKKGRDFQRQKLVIGNIEDPCMVFCSRFDFMNMTFVYQTDGKNCDEQSSY